MSLYIMDPSTICKLFFGLGTAVDLGGTLIPSFRESIMNYGSRGINTRPTNADDSKSRLKRIFEYIAAIQVPHTWFTHYYIVSVASSIFWAHQIYTHGPAFEYLVSHSKHDPEGVTVNQIFMAWLFMALQGSRRLYESITLTKPSKSKMWVGLWLIGIAYYVFMGISVWIEGIEILNQSDVEVKLSKPSVKTLLAAPLFLLASGVQHECHKHLASLKKYTLPQQRFFRYVVCPHYTSECLIYVAIAIVAAPKGYLLNRTVLAGLGFVVSNLGVTADSTKKWYVEKFGAENLAERWRMVPYVY
ncbi:3-oxo-5-alpha-steroid 4-dehydrogenase-like protein [Mollisia scopiformis]|uniref:Polyprenal reductase n=1 Tax=Mollisia scopiformis TaxID=149040 RepID=A0A194XLJ7_MOLSC|nr:3-oxo-5-alpha-steroid 4-dehydrogenase-like protein [Mollisia scopiformis]KUJ21053.1 3-oxo-5-alpha-steroid 4-dehydrogenase-like protein [Mollisia scopiformis]